MKTTVVAGGAGFVGSHLCDALIAKGHRVICIDNFATGREKNVKHLMSQSNFRFIKIDITHSRFDSVIKKIGNVDEIYHLASPASPPHYQKEPIATWKANTLGTLNLLVWAKMHRAKFLFASTSEVYGDPLVHPQVESYFGNVNTVGIRSCYDESKRAGESLCMDYYRAYKTPIKIVRIFNTYGPRMDKNDGRVVSNFINQALFNKSITVYGKGNQTRSFQFVSDLVEALLRVMTTKLSFTGPVNLGNPEEFSVVELAQKIISMTGSNSKLVYKPLPQDDPKQRRPDISLAKKVLAWQPKIKIQEGLGLTIEYFNLGR